MPKVEPSVTYDPERFFLLDGLPREKRTWTLVYENENEDVIGDDKIGIVYKKNIESFLVRPTHFSNYVNGSGTPFPTMISLVTSLKELLELSE